MCGPSPAISATRSAATRMCCELRRIWSGPFDTADALTWEELEEPRPGAPELDVAYPPACRTGWWTFRCCRRHAGGRGADAKRQSRHGDGRAGNVEYGDTAWAACRGQPIAIGTYRSGELHPARVFNLPEEPNDLTLAHVTKGDAPSSALYSDCECDTATRSPGAGTRAGQTACSTSC